MSCRINIVGGLHQSCFCPVPDLTGLENRKEVFVFPGFCDVHVHFREPGFSYKETIASGSEAALAGGYTTVCTMPNLDPVPDTSETLAVQEQLIRDQARMRVIPYGAITMGRKGLELADMDAMANRVAAFSDDGSGVQNDDMMRAAMLKARSLGKIIAAHCEQNDLLHGGYIHDGEYARTHGHKGICSESEWKPIERDLKLAAETGCSYHVCHISCKESVDLIRRAKQAGVDVTCETGPHYLILDDSNLQEDGRFKMNPPLRSAEDRMALIEGLKDGTIDIIATDHAPHSAEEKGKGLAGSAMGVVGLETAFSELYTKLVLTGMIPLEKLIKLMAVAPRKRFGIELSSSEYTVWDLDEEWTVDPDKFLSRGKATPFRGDRLKGVCLKTVSPFGSMTR